MLVIVCCVLSCDTGLTNSDNSNLIGYWRSEKTYKDTYDLNSYYDIFIFEQNRVMHFGTTSLEFIKEDDYDSAFYADWWDSYTMEDGKKYQTLVIPITAVNG